MSGMYDSGTGLTFDPDRKMNDARLLVRFYIEPCQSEAKSAAAGRPIFDDVEMVSVVMAGDKRTEVVERVKEQHRQRWPDAYRAFKEGREEAQSGTPLEQWAPLTPAQVAELKAINIKSVEALAGIPDTALPQLGTGGRVLRDKAALWLRQAADGSAVTELQHQNETLSAQMAVMQRTIDDLKANVNKKEPA